MNNHKILKSMVILALFVSGAHAKEQVFNLPAFHVYGNRYNNESNLASKIPTKEKYTPSSVNVVSEKELDKKNAHTLQDALSYETGLIGNYRGDIPFQNYAKIRGVELDTSNFLVDGMRAYSTYMQIFTPEIFGMEKVEVLRGPSSTFNGSGAGSGVINMQLKSPKKYDYTKGEVRIGTKNEKTITFDVNKVNEEKNSAMRFVGLLSKKDLFFDQSSNVRMYIAPSYEKQLEKDRFTIKPFYQYDHVTGSKDQPQIKFGNHPLFGMVPDRAYLGVIDWDRYDLKQWGITTEWEHNFDENISFVQRTSARKTTVLSKQVRGWPKPDFNRIIRDGVAMKLEGNSLGLDNYIRLHKNKEKGFSDTIIGADIHYEKTFQKNLQSYRFQFLDFDDLPDYMSGKRKWVEEMNPYQDQVLDTIKVTGREYGAYVSHNEHIGKFHLSGGIRRGFYEQHSNAEQAIKDFRDYATTGQVGIVYELTDEWLPYIHWNHGFTANYAWDDEKKLLPPTTSSEWEGGVRYESRDGKTKGSIAVFNLIQHNVPVLLQGPSPNFVPPEPPAGLEPGTEEFDEWMDKIIQDNKWYFSSVGKVGSKGIDFKFAKQFNDTLNVQASYSFLIAKVLEDGDPSKVGTTMPESPKHTLSLQASKVVRQNEKGKWIVNSGMRYFGEALDQTNTVKIPGAVLYDLGITYERKNDKFSLQAKNIFDREYYVSLYQDHAPLGDPTPNIGFLGDERAVTFTYSRTW